MSVLHHCGEEEAHGEHEWQAEEGGLAYFCIGTAPEYARRHGPPRRPFARIAPPEITWGATLCSRRHCVDTAACLLDGWPFCLLHAEDELERWVALDLNREAVALMPGLEDE